MAGFALTVAILVAVLAVGIRALAARRAERSRPGATPARAIPAPRFDDIDATVRTLRCRCGGALRPVGEGGSGGPERRLRFVLVECRRCERESRIYFDVTRAFH